MINAGWCAGSDVLTLFPTLVWKLQLVRTAYEPLNAAILEEVAALRGPAASLADGESWQSPHGLHRRAPLRPLVEYVNSAVDSVLTFLRVASEGLVITGCWVTVNARGRAHQVHTHPNNFLSGVYYVQVAPGADTINFHDPRPQTALVRPPVVDLTSANTDQVVVKIEAGALLLFPSWLAHSVVANASKRERVSVSFNLMFAHFTESLAGPMWGTADAV